MTKTEKKKRTKSGQKNGSKTILKRDSHGRFMPGHSGGPGRGHKKKQAEAEIDNENLNLDLLEIIEKAARKGLLNANDWKDRLRAAGIGLKLLGFKKPEDEPAPASPLARRFIMFTANILPRFAMEANVSKLEMLDKMIEGCPYCTRFGSGDSDTIGGVKLGLDETNNMNKVDRK